MAILTMEVGDFHSKPTNMLSLSSGKPHRYFSVIGILTYRKEEWEASQGDVFSNFSLLIFNTAANNP